MLYTILMGKMLQLNATIPTRLTCCKTLYDIEKKTGSTNLPIGGGKSYLASGLVSFLAPNYILSPVRAPKMNINTFLSGPSVDIM